MLNQKVRIIKNTIIWEHLSREGKRKQVFKERNGVRKDMATGRISVKGFIANLVPANDISFTGYGN